MLEKRTPIPVNEAVTRVMEYKMEGCTEEVLIEESFGRFLGHDLIATHDVPNFDRSPYDGFAIRAVDTKSASIEHPVTLEVVGEIGAGSVFKDEVQACQAVRIMTGAQIPAGCNAVIMLEHVKESSINDLSYITINRKVQSGENISFKGEDTNEGDVLVSKGSIINPGIVALLATFGYKNVTVASKPRIGVLATGSELLDLDEPMVAGKIRNSNAYMVLSQIQRVGANPVHFGQSSDDLELAMERMLEAIKEVDFLITTGGVSVGDYDHLPAIYEKMGATVLFNKIRMRPGSVTTVAHWNGKLLFGLSGNPSACYVGFELFVRPIVRNWMGSEKPYLQRTMATLGADFLYPNPFDRFVRGTVSFKEGSLLAIPSGTDKSNMVSSLAGANALIVLPGGTHSFETGMEVEVLLLDDQVGAERFDLA
ncbi:gephyrin-like molybdotransferase Glp [Peribacillus alkalitolerans]|uniref:molybdopterin molybdotransferase MoeA n=1 Tax=Peribacillus alkalitolerans TaxID=1550385 RepID=UPI0013D42D4E|nr:gephyrin-like molybdotransferase Glp [Peribacillus alkalitolerans]